MANPFDKFDEVNPFDKFDAVDAPKAEKPNMRGVGFNKAMAYNGASIGGVIFAPLWVAAIGWLGFPMATMAIGAVMVVAI